MRSSSSRRRPAGTCRFAAAFPAPSAPVKAQLSGCPARCRAALRLGCLRSLLRSLLRRRCCSRRGADWNLGAVYGGTRSLQAACAPRDATRSVQSWLKQVFSGVSGLTSGSACTSHGHEPLNGGSRGAEFRKIPAKALLRAVRAAGLFQSTVLQETIVNPGSAKALQSLRAALWVAGHAVCSLCQCRPCTCHRRRLWFRWNKTRFWSSVQMPQGCSSPFASLSSSE